MSLRRFEGWEPLVETVYEVDDLGRTVRSVSRAEPEWDTEQQILMLALAEAERGECSGCGHPLGESTDPKHEGRYKVAAPVRCHACNALQIAYEKAKDYKHPEALRWSAHLPHIHG